MYLLKKNSITFAWQLVLGSPPRIARHSASSLEPAELFSRSESSSQFEEMTFSSSELPAPEMCTSAQMHYVSYKWWTLKSHGKVWQWSVFFFPFIFYFLYFLALFGFLLQFSEGSQRVTFFFLVSPHQGLASLEKREVQYGFLAYFLVLREGFFPA